MQAVLDASEAVAFERAAEMFGVLSTPTRLRILAELCRREMCVSELVTAVDIPQPTVSQHLGLLFRAGLVGRRKKGVQVYYKVEPKTRGFLCRTVKALVQ